MADILRIRAHNGKGISWTWEDASMAEFAIELDQPPTKDMTIGDGDVWHVELVDTKTSPKSKRKTAVVRLISLIRKTATWETITALDDHWIDPLDLKCILAWLHRGVDVILIGPKGTGKTSLGYAIARTLGWQEPCKVDVYVIKRTTDLFGTDAAHEGSTRFVRSALFDYIERAQIAYDHGLDTHFLVIMDEINRVHAKSNESLHGLFDDRRQVTIVTTDGAKIIKLPPNLHVIGTMNMGAEYLGIHGLDDALKDRFAPMQVRPMPEDEEVRRLVAKTALAERQARAIVQTARRLRLAAAGGQISFAPSFRACRNAAWLVQAGIELKVAVIKAFLAWYEGELAFDSRGEVVQANTEVAKAYAALRMAGVAKVEEIVKDELGRQGA